MSAVSKTRLFLRVTGGAAVVLCLLGFAYAGLMGEGALRRNFTLSGVYPVAVTSGGYDVVCFLDADGAEGGLFCMPRAQARGECP